MHTAQHNHLTFVSRYEKSPGEKMADWFFDVWPAYQRWFNLNDNPASAQKGRQQLQMHMPELVQTYDRLCLALGAEEQMAAFLSLYNPPAFRAGCSQMAWARSPFTLLRNYDFPAHMCDRQLLYSRWNNTGVIAMTDCLWGVLDGINEHGLTLSLAFGGHDKKGDGFAITLVLRYILEFCSTTMEALAVLQRVPVHMPYNITVLDRAGEARTAVVCPEMDLEVTTLTFATNHQQCGGAMASDAIADSRLREAFLSTRLGDKAQDLEMMHGMFLHEPLLRKASDWNGWGTLYTSRYDVEHGAVELCWPGDQILQQNFNNFQEGTITVTSPAFL